MTFIQTYDYYLNSQSSTFGFGINLRTPSYGQAGYEEFMDGRKVTVYWELLLGSKLLDEAEDLSGSQLALAQKGFLANAKDFFEDEATSGSVVLSYLKSYELFNFKRHKDGFEEDELFGIRLSLDDGVTDIDIKETTYYTIKGAASQSSDSYPRLTLFDQSTIFKEGDPPQVFTVNSNLRDDYHKTMLVDVKVNVLDRGSPHDWNYYSGHDDFQAPIQTLQVPALDGSTIQIEGLQAIDDKQSESIGYEYVDIELSYPGDSRFYKETGNLFKVYDRIQVNNIQLGVNRHDRIDLALLVSWASPTVDYQNGVPPADAFAQTIYAQPGAAADLITFDSLSDAHKQPGSAERAVFLSNNLDLSDIGSGYVPDDNRYGTSSDGVHSKSFVAVYGFFGQYTSDISFGISGTNKFTDVITDAVTGGTSADGTLDLYLTNGSNGDAFFLHDAFSDYHKDVETKKDAFGRDYAARIANIKSIFAGDADDIIDLTTTESANGISGGGVKTVYAGNGADVILGSTGTVYGEEGNDTLISHHSTVMSGGAGGDLFGFLATPAMQDSVTGVVSEPVHKILDFETGVDSIKFYVSSDLESTGSMQTGNAGHITKTADGDIEWMYFHAGQTSKTMTVDMNGQSWSMDDIDFITYTSTTPEIV